MKIRLKEMRLENFKGIKELDVKFSNQTEIMGQNAAGKTTIFDAFTWLLFGKNSAGAEKFNLRPLDAEGKQIDNVEIKLTALMEVDGKEVEFAKIQKQNWVKKRGTDVTTLQGNINSFEIDGYPKSEADFKVYINSLIPEEVFKMLTNPAYFVSLEWKKQRDILMKFVSGVTDLEIAAGIEKFAPLIPELEKAPSTDDIRKKYAKALTEWKKRQEELPARIDEASRQLVDVDVAELELYRNQLKDEISEAEKSMDDLDHLYAEYQHKADEVYELRKSVIDYQTKASQENVEKRRAIQKKINDCEHIIGQAEGCAKLAKMDADRLENMIVRAEEERTRLLSEYDEAKNRKYPAYEPLIPLDESSLICPTCGQELPDEVRAQKMAEYADQCAAHEKTYEEAKAAFEADRQKCMNDIVSRGQKRRADIDAWKAGAEQKTKEIAEHEKNSAAARAEKENLLKILSDIPAEADLSEDQVFAEMQLSLSKMEEAMKSVDSGADARNQARIHLSGMRETLAGVEQKIASADNSSVEARIEELKAEQRAVSQKVADQENMIDLLEDFIREKMKKISENINGKFNTVSWKLFDMQINGGMKECCECAVNGVPYSTLNSGHRIVAGLDIIHSLSELYDTTAPIWIDNAESINKTNIPAMDAQMILLEVSDDKQLKVEV